MQRSQSTRLGEGARAQSAKRLSVTAAGRESTAPVGAVEPPPRSAVLESALVKNLKKQIACLEMEVVVLKRTLMKGSELGAHPKGDEFVGDAFSAETGQNLGSSAADAVPCTASAHVSPRSLWIDADKRDMRRQKVVLNANMAALQFTVQRLQLDKEALEGRLRCEEQEKRKMAAENARLFLELRESCGKEEETHTRLSEVLNALNTEQERRRDLENKLRLSAELPPVEGGEGQGADLWSEKEYYRVQTDRLRVSQQEKLACIGELEKQLKIERNRAAELESKLSTALEEVQRLNRLTAENSSTYESMDKSYVGMCTLLQMATDDYEALQHQLEKRPTETSLPGSLAYTRVTPHEQGHVSPPLEKEAVDEKDCRRDEEVQKEENSMSKAAKSSCLPPPPAVTVPVATLSTSVTALGPNNQEEIPLHNAVDDELETIERRIREEEAALFAYLNSR
ncbi:hypothetical protein MOQ_001215 [Trypanosoma cruzi marinkellei]|uniref:Uncharacterized protein n=1 Tax=Trypanosoma cruzi marinkellei TaxID=85056 RepID=K2NUD0_TRYCR|nr:hypothetical protein MOQ_001215 [Trypanosoma cruzi marinkellei]